VLDSDGAQFFLARDIKYRAQVFRISFELESMKAVHANHPWFDWNCKVMSNKIFKSVDLNCDPHWIVKEFFNSIYRQGKFLWALPLIVEKKGCGLNEEFCFFPDLNDPDPVYHFSGVMFGTMGDEVIISDEQCNAYLQEACDRYLHENPDDHAVVTRMLNDGRR
jgi:hypothetical protein